jgi:hypothetical protein
MPDAKLTGVSPVRIRIDDDDVEAGFQRGGFDSIRSGGIRFALHLLLFATYCELWICGNLQHSKDALAVRH